MKFAQVGYYEVSAGEFILGTWMVAGGRYSRIGTWEAFRAYVDGRYNHIGQERGWTGRVGDGTIVWPAGDGTLE